METKQKRTAGTLSFLGVWGREHNSIHPTAVIMLRKPVLVQARKVMYDLVL
jgi:hypothetical protein